MYFSRLAARNLKSMLNVEEFRNLQLLFDKLRSKDQIWCRVIDPSLYVDI